MTFIIGKFKKLSNRRKIILSKENNFIGNLIILDINLYESYNCIIIISMYCGAHQFNSVHIFFCGAYNSIRCTFFEIGFVLLMFRNILIIFIISNILNILIHEFAHKYHK